MTLNLELWDQGLCRICKKKLTEWEMHFGICKECSEKLNREGLELKSKPRWHRSLDE